MSLGAVPWGAPVPRDPSTARAYELADGLWQLRLPLPYEFVATVNTYLLESVDGWILVDCGSSLEPGWESLVTALRHAGRVPEDLSLLVCTHTHCDHFGLAATIVERTGCELWIPDGPPVAFDRLREPELPMRERQAAARAAGIPADQIDTYTVTVDGGDGHHRRPAPDRRLREGDVVPGGWSVVDASGHAPNQIALHHGRSGWLISADLALAGVSPYLEHGYGGDPVAEHLRSVERALALRPTRLLPGHGRPVDDAADLLRASGVAVEERLERLVAQLDDTPRTPYELSLLRVEGGAAAHPAERQTVMSATLCDLDHLERRGRAQRVVTETGAHAFTAA